jgi:preprotein translocase subunit SecG
LSALFVSSELNFQFIPVKRVKKLMITILTIIHIIVCVFLVSIVLLQHGKGADIGATFGGSGQSLFGTEGPVPLLNKITTASAVIFMVTSIALAYLSSHQTTGSVMGGYSVPAAPVEQPGKAAEPLPEKIPMPATAPEQPAPAQFPGNEGGKASE